MKRYLFEGLSILGSFASLIGLTIFNQPLKSWQWLIVGITLVFVVFSIIMIYSSYRRENPKPLNNDQEIDSYLHNWLKKGGNCVIFSRDMSWAVRNHDIKEMLISKANRNELHIYLPQRIPFCDELEKAGAHITLYNYERYEPKSRFTIINKGHGVNAKLSIGQRTKEGHINIEYGPGDHVFAVANDLIDIITQLCPCQKTVN
ncbi:MAG: hypothetical protein VR72_02555 [Clostridiaceae bacterium BRH_c20a]|nr:MAG: hypothetical protein VR72_02555 [Clostridiaceae bacterium BRH_c20a]